MIYDGMDGVYQIQQISSKRLPLPQILGLEQQALQNVLPSWRGFLCSIAGFLYRIVATPSTVSMIWEPAYRTVNINITWLESLRCCVYVSCVCVGMRVFKL